MSILTNIKNYFYVGIALIIFSVLFALNHYYEKSKNLNKQLEHSNTLIVNLTSEISKKDAEIKSIKEKIIEQNFKINDISKKANDYKNEVDLITQKFNSERILKIADKKPKLLEKVFNNSVKKEVEELNKLTKNKR